MVTDPGPEEEQEEEEEYPLTPSFLRIYVL